MQGSQGTGGGGGADRPVRRLCYGGSFNPIHHGHLLVARAAAEALGFDRVVLIPSATPPHKRPGGGMASAEDRLAMCRLAAGLDPLFEASDVEVRRSAERGTPSYTIETARHLTGEGWGRVSWLVGADMVMDLPNWRQPEDLLREVDFVVVARPGWEMDWGKLPAEYRHLARNVVAAPLVDVSATMIRQRVAAGLSIAYLTPEVVVEYVRERGLYGGKQ